MQANTFTKFCKSRAHCDRKLRLFKSLLRYRVRACIPGCVRNCVSSRSLEEKYISETRRFMRGATSASALEMKPGPLTSSFLRVYEYASDITCKIFFLSNKRYATVFFYWFFYWILKGTKSAALQAGIMNFKKC